MVLIVWGSAWPEDVDEDEGIQIFCSEWVLLHCLEGIRVREREEEGRGIGSCWSLNGEVAGIQVGQVLMRLLDIKENGKLWFGLSFLQYRICPWMSSITSLLSWHHLFHKEF